MNAFGANTDAGASHYIQAGRFEGRHISFDALEYIASYEDLIKAFGANGDAGRATTSDRGTPRDGMSPSTACSTSPPTTI